MTSRCCKRPANDFCYICGEFIKFRARKYEIKKSLTLSEAYAAYFGVAVGDQDKIRAPHVTCEKCTKTLKDKVSSYKTICIKY